MRFVHDPTDHELIADPVVIADGVARSGFAFGDCDDYVVYMAALMKAVGLRPAFKIVGQNGQFHHVLVSVLGIDLDATRPVWEHSPVPVPNVMEEIPI